MRIRPPIATISASTKGRAPFPSSRVYTFGAEGQLHALDLADGKRVWSVDTARRFGVPKGFFGAAGSPLVEDGRVVANIGGRDNGKDAGIVKRTAMHVCHWGR